MIALPLLPDPECVDNEAPDLLPPLILKSDPSGSYISGDIALPRFAC
jgi:hypothetical protein